MNLESGDNQESSSNDNPEHGITIALCFKCHAPLNYARFLDYCADRIFLRKVGGGYIFVHCLLLEHFAALTDADIQRLASPVGAKPSTKP